MKRTTLILLIAGSVLFLIISCLGGNNGKDPEPLKCGENLTFPAEYWIVDQRYDHDFSAGGTTWGDFLEKTEVSVMWGSIVFNAPDDESGIGTYRFDSHLPYAEGGIASHNHDVGYWDSTDPGYIDGADDAAMVGTFILEGTQIRMFYDDVEEGYFSCDGSVFSIIFKSADDLGEWLFGVKKPQDFSSSDITGKWMSIGHHVELGYAPAGTLEYGEEEIYISAWDFDTGSSMDWKSEHYISLAGVGEPIEGVNWEATGMSAGIFGVDPDGFSNLDEPLFWAFGSGGAYVEANDATEHVDGNHILQHMFGINMHDSPTLAMVAGTWKLFGSEYGSAEGADGWGSGDEELQLTRSYATVNIAAGSFSYAGSVMDPFYTGSIVNDLWTADILGPYTEYMVIDQEVSTSPIDSAIAVPLFHVTEPGNADSIIFRAAISTDKNVMVVWSPIDVDNIPSDGGTALDHVFLGAAVRIP